ncbi:MAG: FAD-dependent monooxygenase [Haloarculaceae archaeon]
MEHVDVAVVGGGPAGTSAAHAAATQGADAVVFEKGVPREDREGPGPDSTDAAGMLDYWVDIMDIGEVPDHVRLRELEGADFLGPTTSVELRSTGIDASYPNFGFTFHRARFDDWLRERAEDAGAQYRVGTGVMDVDSDLTGAPTHTLTLRDGTEVVADYLVLADGPQRTVTTKVLEPLLPDGQIERIDPTTANHIAYQEYREIPEEVFEPSLLKFWWGYMPGHTAYPWIFPNDGRVARVGLTMPIGLDLSTVRDRSTYRLLRPEDEQVPHGSTYVERLLELVYGDRYDVEEDFPLVTDRGKRGGTETYPISSTRPIESPVDANVAVVGGAMGATSAFHEGGDHVAVRTGKLAGELAASGTLDAYNRAWQAAIGEEVARNVAMADMVHDWTPTDWDRAFGAAASMLGEGGVTPWQTLRGGVTGLKLYAGYKWRKRGLRDGGYVQIRESEYVV